ncbi:hypothetical protein DUI87_10529 [Hirundo rustica rustica]|uniref:Reverse transcriptase domain-containing protein n=1 Tax=Hirundo rustica rustica TaxID=333673 RepID=A0A3M0KQ45_HIRRU|nr:hypothetical protein DUI87_10529 [Hirundo rustica rustica]
MYTSACSINNKQELEAMVQQQSYDVVAITKTWWDESHSWSAALDGYKLFRRDRKGRRGGGVTLYVREAFDAMDIETSDNEIEYLWAAEWSPVSKEEAVRELLRCLDTHKTMGPDGIHPRVMRELADELVKPALHHCSLIYQHSWLTGEVPNDWKLTNVTPIHKMDRKEDPGNYRSVSLTSVPGKVMEQFILSVITQHLRDGQGIRPSQHRFRRGRSCLTNLVSFYDLVTHLVDAGRAVDVVYLDSSKAFDTVSHSSLLDKLAARGLDRSTLCWVRNWLDGRAQRVVVNGAASSWGQAPVVSLREVLPPFLMVSALASDVSILELTGMSVGQRGNFHRRLTETTPLSPHYRYLPHKPNPATSAKVCIDVAAAFKSALYWLKQDYKGPAVTSAEFVKDSKTRMILPDIHMGASVEPVSIDSATQPVDG